jgi:hypothetical protein
MANALDPLDPLQTMDDHHAFSKQSSSQDIQV